MGYNVRPARQQDVVLPFRWDPSRGDQVGDLLDGIPGPNIWYWNDLVRCAVEVLGRSSGGGYVCFVGRSLDSVYDFLSGALWNTIMAERLIRLPISCKSAKGLSRPEAHNLRAVMTACGITPLMLQGRHPVILCDVVDTALTFTNLFYEIRRWVIEEGQWDVARKRLRFTGVVKRSFPSPDTWRWYQHMNWTKYLPREGVSSIAMNTSSWEYLTNQQQKATVAFGPSAWGHQWVFKPRRDNDARCALSEACALISYGKQSDVRKALGHLLSLECRAMRDPSLRKLASELSGT